MTDNIQRQSSLQLWFAVIGIGAIALGINIFVYRPILELPLFFDDLVQLPFVDRYSILEHWLGSNESPYYRPLTVTFWKLILGLGDPYPNFLLHGINLAFHIVNSFLSGLLGFYLLKRLAPDARPQKSIWTAILMAGLYAIFPFHYQAVPWVAALFHILVTTLILVALIAHLKSWWFTALSFTFLAPFAHENGIAVFPLIILIELLALGSTAENRKNKLGRLALYLIPITLWGGVRLAVSTARAGDSLFPGWESVGQSLTYFVQGLGWPGGILTGRWVNQLPINDLTLVWLSAAAVLLLAASVLIKSNHWRIGALAVAVWLLGSLPAMSILTFGYVINSPRLLTFAGVGVSLFWAIVIVDSFEQIVLNRSWPSFLLPVTVFLLFSIAQVQGLTHLNEKLDFHTKMGDAWYQAAEISETFGDGEAYPVFINLPSTMAPLEKRFPLGNEVVIFWPGYAPQHSVVTTNRPMTGINQAFTRVDHIRTEQPYRNSLIEQTGPINGYWLDPNAQFFNTQFSTDSIDLVPVGGVIPSEGQVQQGKLAEPNGAFALSLKSFSAEQFQIDEADHFQLNVEWFISGSTTDNLTFFVHGINEQGEILAQADGDLLAGSMPLNQVGSGTNFGDIRYLPAEQELTHIRIGAYDRLSGERYPLLDKEGNRYPEDMVILPINQELE